MKAQPISIDEVVRDEILYLPLASIDPDPEQPRLDVDDELAESIKQHGVLQAIQVRPHPVDADRWMLVDGERRYRGSLRAKLDTIPATITLEVEDVGDRIVRQLVRNEGKPLTPVEEALAFKKIIDAKQAAGDKKYGVTQLARDLGLAKSTISDRLTLTEIPAFWLELIAKGPLQASHAPLLHKWRGVPEKYQRIALEQMTKDYRWTNRRVGGGEERIYVSVFDTLIETFFYKFAKPIGEVPGYEGPTQKLEARSSYPRRIVVHAMDPSKWGPIFRKRAAAKRANQPKQSSRSSDTDWRAQQEAEEKRRRAEEERWRQKFSEVIETLVAAVNAGTLDEQLSQLLIDQFHDSYRSKEYKTAVARVPIGETSTQLIRHMAFRSILLSIEHPYQGTREWPKIEKRLGLAAQRELAADKPKRGKKAKSGAESVPVADADDAEFVDVPDYEIVDADTPLGEVAAL